MPGGPCLFPLSSLVRAFGDSLHLESYPRRYDDQKRSTAQTWILRNLVDGLPSTWSIMLQVRCDRSIGAGKIRRITNRIRSNTRSIKPRPVPFSYKATKNPLYGESDSAEWRMEEQDQRSDRGTDGQSGEKASRIWRGEGEVIHGS